MGDIERAKVGKWEKIGYLALLGAFFPSFIVLELLESGGLGWWERYGAALLISCAIAYLLSRPAVAERANRLASDLERGVFDCAIRYPNAHPGSLRDRWNPGVAQYQDGQLLFQPQNFQGDPNPTPMGQPRDLRVVSVKGLVEPDKRPVDLRRGWKVLELETGGGAMHLAAGEPGLDLLQGRELS